MIRPDQITSIAGALTNHTLADLDTLLPYIVANHGALLSPEGVTPASFTLAGVTHVSTHSHAAAAQAWGLAFLNRDAAVVPTGPKGCAGVDGEVIDPFVRNAGLDR